MKKISIVDIHKQWFQTLSPEQQRYAQNHPQWHQRMFQIFMDKAQLSLFDTLEMKGGEQK